LRDLEELIFKSTASRRQQDKLLVVFFFSSKMRFWSASKYVKLSPLSRISSLYLCSSRQEGLDCFVS
jgi:hypothetical protein